MTIRQPQKLGIKMIKYIFRLTVHFKIILKMLKLKAHIYFREYRRL